MVIVQARASRDEILGFHGDVLQVKVTEVPERGKANEAAIELLARAARVPKSSISIVRGHGSREKVMAIGGLSPDDLRSRLSGY